MLTAIEIKNYRGIQQGKISGFGQVNLFVGPNGSGKSSLLEAIFLGAVEKSAEFYFQGLFQNSRLALIAQRHNESNFPSVDLCYRKNPSPMNPISITYDFGSEKQSVSIQSAPDSSSSFTSNKIPVDSAFFKRMRFLDIRVLLDRGVEQRAWDQLLNIRGDREIRSVLNKVYGLNIESLTYSANSQTLKALFADRNYALNIDDLGAGIRIAFRMMIAILLSEESAVLAEEFDGYQHIESFPRFVSALIQVSKKAQTQLFLATHSLETVRNFIEQARNGANSIDLRVYQTSLSKDGLFEASSFSAEEAETLMTGGFDVRRTS